MVNGEVAAEVESSVAANDVEDGADDEGGVEARGVEVVNTEAARYKKRLSVGTY